MAEISDRPVSADTLPALCDDVYPLIGWQRPGPYLLDRRCCWSCHQDLDDYSISMCWQTLPDGREAHICCAVAIALDSTES